jgi:hypothetical protein
MNTELYDPKIQLYTGIGMVLLGLFLPYLDSSYDPFMRGIIFGIGIGVISSNLYRVFKLDK